VSLTSWRHQTTAVEIYMLASCHTSYTISPTWPDSLITRSLAPLCRLESRRWRLLQSMIPASVTQFYTVSMCKHGWTDQDSTWGGGWWGSEDGVSDDVPNRFAVAWLDCTRTNVFSFGCLSVNHYHDVSVRCGDVSLGCVTRGRQHCRDMLPCVYSL